TLARFSGVRGAASIWSMNPTSWSIKGSSRGIRSCRRRDGLSPNGTPDALQKTLRQRDRNRVSELPHGLTPGFSKHIIVRECLESGGFPDGEVPNGFVMLQEHVFATRDTVVPRFQGLRRFIQWAPRVPLVGARAGNKIVV